MLTGKGVQTRTCSKSKDCIILTCVSLCVRTGTTREDEVGDRKVVGLDYEAYEPMVQSEFNKLCADIRQRWPSVAHICVHHRLGLAANANANCGALTSVFRSVSYPPSPLPLLPQVGEGGWGQRCHGDLVSSSPWRPASGPALHHPVKGQPPHLEEGNTATVLMTDRSRWLIIDPVTLIDRKFTTHRKRVGRRTQSVPGPVTTRFTQKTRTWSKVHKHQLFQ